jgi:hypothetical protein
MITSFNAISYGLEMWKSSYCFCDYAINREYATYKQLIAQNDANYFANKLLNSKYNRYQISNYFEKHLGENSNYGTLMGM